MALTQIFAAFKNPDFWGLHLIFGKFSSPVLQSPLLWDHDFHPEGAFESFTFKSVFPSLDLAIYAGQFSVDQPIASISDGTPRRRSWLFEQGVMSVFRFQYDAEIKTAVNQYTYFDLSERLANFSGQQGNTFMGTIDSNARFRYEYAPVELVSEWSAKPLGIRSALYGAFAINFRTPDQQRSFFIRGSIGNDWSPDHFVLSLVYFYHEPDTTVAYFSDDEFGYSNRKGALAKLTYAPLKFLKLGASFLFAEALASSPFQNERKELKTELEMVF